MSEPLRHCSCALEEGCKSVGGFHLREILVVRGGRRVQMADEVFERCPAWARAAGRQIIGNGDGILVNLSRPVQPFMEAAQ